MRCGLAHPCGRPAGRLQFHIYQRIMTATSGFWSFLSCLRQRFAASASALPGVSLEAKRAKGPGDSGLVRSASERAGSEAGISRAHGICRVAFPVGPDSEQTDQSSRTGQSRLACDPQRRAAPSRSAPCSLAPWTLSSIAWSGQERNREKEQGRMNNSLRAEGCSGRPCINRNI